MRLVKSRISPKKPTASPLTKDDMFRHVRFLMQHGLALLPLKTPVTGDARSGKVPATPHGVDDATKDFRKFRALVGEMHSLNLGVATGRASGIVILDIDPRNGGIETLFRLQAVLGPLPNTVTVLTSGGGKHFYFRAPDEPLHSAKLGAGVDFLAERKYAVAPPSLHGSGHRYRWAKDLAPDKVRIAPLPRAWLKFLEAPTSDVAAQGGRASSGGDPGRRTQQRADQDRRSPAGFGAEPT